MNILAKLHLAYQGAYVTSLLTAVNKEAQELHELTQLYSKYDEAPMLRRVPL